MLEQKLKLNNYNKIENFNNRFFLNINLNFLRYFNIFKVINNSYINFFQFNVKADKRKFIGLQKIFLEIFPININKYNTRIDFLSYNIEKPLNSYTYCINNGLTYSFIIKLNFSLTVFKNNTFKEVKKISKEQIFFSIMPMMTKNNTFVINGIEKVLVSNFVRAPGLYLTFDKKKKKIAKVIPDNGYEIIFFIDKNNLLILQIKDKLVLLTDLIKSFGFSNRSILNEFYDFEIICFFKKKIKLKFVEKFFLNFSIPYDILNKNKEILVNKNTIITLNEIKIIKSNFIEYIDIDKNYILNRFLGDDIYFNNVKIASCNDLIDNKFIKKLSKFDFKEFKVVFISSKAHSSICLSLNVGESYKFDYFNFVEFRNNFINSIGFNFLKSSFSSYNENNYKFSYNYNNYFFLSKLCRKRINIKLNRNNFNGVLLLDCFDLIDISKLLISYIDNISEYDDMKDVENLILNSSGDIIEKLIYDNILSLKSIVLNKFISSSKKKTLKPSDFLNFSLFNSKIRRFFNVSKFSQFLDQTNSLSELAHKRKVSLLGVVGISKLHSGFEVRELHSSHYSKLCPVETSEGINIGIISSLALFCNINKDKTLIAPYYKIIKNNIKKKIFYLTPGEEKKKVISNLNSLKLDSLTNETSIISRFNNVLVNSNLSLIEYTDINSYQTLSISASLIPFIQHNDSNRALMASNMLKQALPLIKPNKPLVGTGIELLVGMNTNNIIFSKSNGIVEYVSNDFLIIKKFINIKNFYYYDFDFYFLNKYKISNQNTDMSQRVLVNLNDIVKKNDILIDNSCSKDGELSLGQNVLVAFMSWEGYNFEDSIIVSKRLVYDDIFTSLKLFQIDVPVYDTNFGSEYVTKNIHNINNVNLSNLDESGIVNLGSLVGPGSILVGKTTPLSPKDNNVTSEKKIINSIIFKKNLNEADSSYYLNNNITDSTVRKIDIFFSKNFELNNSDKKFLKDQLENYIKEKKEKFLFFYKKLKKKLKDFLIQKEIFLKNKSESFIIDSFYLKNIKIKTCFKINICDEELDKIYKKILFKFKKFIINYKIMLKNKKKKFFKNLPINVIKIIKIFLVSKRRLMVGDKMSGRHGNKGVVSKILPLDEMPYMSDGRIIDVILNPLGVPSRMNIGQLFEVHLGLANFFLGLKISFLLKKKEFLKLKELFIILYKNNFINFNVSEYNDKDLSNFSKKFVNGFYFSITPFSNFGETEINFLLNLIFFDNFFDLKRSPCNKKFYLYNGKNNKMFDNPVTVGIMYFLKLNHLVEDKIHARSVGPYSLITQQPLKGRSNMGGQRLGEMEVWALEAHGASNSLIEMLTIKSDDTEGRNKIYNDIIKNKSDCEINEPETFSVMMRNVNSLGIYIRFKENEKSKI